MTFTNIKPTGFNIVVSKVTENIKQSKDSLIHIPEAIQQGVFAGAIYYARVISKGNKVSKDINIGDIVVLPEYHGLKLELGDNDEKNLTVANSRDVLGLLI